MSGEADSSGGIPQPLKRAPLGSFFRRLLGSFLGIGRLPPMPGTYASAVAAAAGWGLIAWLGWYALVSLICLSALFAVWAGKYAESDFGRHDPHEFVLDECAGQWVAMLGLAFFAEVRWWHVAAAFVLFRLFDILKPWPANRLDRLRSGFGIVADDVAAGLYALIALGVWAALR